MTRARMAKPAPTKKVLLGPCMSQNTPAITLAQNCASPEIRLNIPNAVPLRSGGAVSATNAANNPWVKRSEEHTSELQSLMRNSYAVFCLKKKITNHQKD